MAHGFSVPLECPVCGEAVPRNAKACPGCGADERSGWDEDVTRYDGLDLPATAYDDETEQVTVARMNRDRFWLFIAVVMALVLVVLFVVR